MIKISDLIGLIGVIIVLTTYFLLQAGKLHSRSISYSLLNAISSCLILWSLYFSWNLSAAIVEIFWLLISVYGLYQSLK